MGRIDAILRLNMSGHAADGRAEADRYAAALDMAAYADASGFAAYARWSTIRAMRTCRAG